MVTDKLKVFLEKKYLILCGVAGFLIALDQIIKVYIHTHYELGESFPIVNGFFNITYVRNFGAAFGLLSQSHPTFREVFFLSIPPIALIIILIILKGVRENDHVQILALSSVFGGALGNYIDRLRFRYVIDFLDFHWKDFYTYPAFNVADMSIVIGVCILFLLMFLENQKKQEPSENIDQ